jgi:hypothetical protein
VLSPLLPLLWPLLCPLVPLVPLLLLLPPLLCPLVPLVLSPLLPLLLLLPPLLCPLLCPLVPLVPLLLLLPPLLWPLLAILPPLVPLLPPLLVTPLLSENAEYQGVSLRWVTPAQARSQKALFRAQKPPAAQSAAAQSAPGAAAVAGVSNALSPAPTIATTGTASAMRSRNVRLNGFMELLRFC